MAVLMELHKIIISEMQDQQIIMLKEVDGERVFPIVIGSGEAYAIDRRLKGTPTARAREARMRVRAVEPGSAASSGAQLLVPPTFPPIPSHVQIVGTSIVFASPDRLMTA